MQRLHTIFSSIHMGRLLPLLSMIAYSSLATASTTSTHTFQFQLKEDSKIWLEGDSTLHAYECTTYDIGVDSTLIPRDNANPEQSSNLRWKGQMLPNLQNMTLSIPVKTLKSPTKGLGSVMHKSLKAKEHPNITFILNKYTFTDINDDKGTASLTASGSLEIAGKTQPIDIEMLATITNGLAMVTGEEPILMTDYGIKPPSFLYGAMSASNRIVVKWNLNISLKEKEPDSK